MDAPDSVPPGMSDGSDPQAITASFYTELRSAAAHLLSAERSGHTLQPTALVNEACLRIIRHGLPAIPREQQLAMAARVLRQVLIDHARGRDTLKRQRQSIGLDIADTLAISQGTIIDFDHVHAAIEKLTRLNERQAEIVTLRVFGGLTMEQVATVQARSKRAVEGDWAIARAWLRRELAASAGWPSHD